MILSAILLGAGLLVGTSLIVTYWNNIISWLKKAINKVKEIVDGVVYGTKVFIKKMKEAIKEISKHYSKDEVGRWTETTITREIPENEVPEEIRRKAMSMSGEVDITDELEMQLS